MIGTAFILGLLSSFHCVGMCGPLAMSLPINNFSIPKKNFAIFLYHLGRIITYLSLGVLFGLLGRHLFIAGYQQILSISVGIIILIIILFQRYFKINQATYISMKISGIVQKGMGYIWKHHSLSSSLLFGMLNGLLPCGMVYYALAAGFSTGSIHGIVYFMLFFGLGTLGLLLPVHLYGVKFLSLPLRNRMKKIIPLLLGCIGILLILRGLNLGIPYISPFLGHRPSDAILCH